MYRFKVFLGWNEVLDVKELVFNRTLRSSSEV